MAPFYGWGSTVSRLQPPQGNSLLFTTASGYSRMDQVKFEEDSF